MSFTNLLLGGNWPPDEWPDYIEADHEGGLGDGPRRYVPERTCRPVGYAFYADEGAVVCACSECGETLVNFDFEKAPPRPVGYCPGCGARVVDE